MTTKILSIVLLLSMGFIACKKESTTQPKTTQEKLLGKWNYVSTVSNIVFGGSSQTMTNTGAAGDYVDFRNDGKVYSYITGSRDTAAYSIINDSKMWIDNASDTFDIRVLTENNLQLYHKEIYSATDYIESTVKMKR